MSRASFGGSALSRTSTNMTEQDIPGDYPDTEASQLVSSRYTLSEAIHARRADFTKEHDIRIKIGSWNVAGKKGTEHDVAKWFVQGEAVSEGLSGLRLEDEPAHHPADADARENIQDQEARHSRKTSTTPKNDSGQLPAADDIGLYVLGLQEMVDISSASEALRPYSDPSTAKRWKEKLEASLPSGYQLVAEQQLIGLMLFIYASPSVMPHISAVSTKTCGTGLMGYMGNKGAVVTRVVLGETTRLVFINSHLSSGLGKAELERRNWDAQQIVNRVKFDPIVDSLGCVAASEERIGEEDFCFWFGDLNYRLVDIPGHDVRRLLELHTKNEYDQSAAQKGNPQGNGHASKASVSSTTSTIERPATSSSTTGSIPPSPTSTTSSRQSFEDSQSTPRTSTADDDEPHESLDPGLDPAHLQTTLNSLLTHDELFDQQKKRKMFHDGWREGPITFLPTYKYDVGRVGVFDSGEKKRAPSWCDRILYRTRKDKLDFDNVLLEEEEAKRKDATISQQGVDKAAEDEDNMLYDYDPEADADDDFQDRGNATGDTAQATKTKEGYDDIIQLEYYISHQRVLSSDHKPLDAVFKLQYDAADPELKSRVHSEVAKDLDRVENEGRPVVTVVPDATPDEAAADEDGINFGSIHFEEEVVRSLTVANTGRAPASFGFLNRPDVDSGAMSSSPSWLSMDVEVETDQSPGGAKRVTKSKNSGFEWASEITDVYSLEPGDACIVRMTIRVDKQTLVKKLNNGFCMEDVLILRIRDGRDHFMPIRGSWCQTSFCRSISDLVKIPEGGIRKVQADQPPEARKRNSLQDSAVRWSAPRELFLLTETIESAVERIVAEWSMLGPETDAEQPSPWEKFAGWPFVEESWTLESGARLPLRLVINEALDNGESLEKTLDQNITPIHRLEAFAETLLLFLASLTDGVIPEILWKELETKFFTKERAKAKRSIDDQKAQVLEVLSFSSQHSVTFVLITSMLSRIVHEVATHCHEETRLSRSNTELPTSPKLPVPMKLLDPDRNVARKQLIRKNLAVVFAKALIRGPEPSSAKARYALIEQKQELIEIFLDSDVR